MVLLFGRLRLCIVCIMVMWCESLCCRVSSLVRVYLLMDDIVFDLCSFILG